MSATLHLRRADNLVEVCEPWADEISANEDNRISQLVRNYSAAGIETVVSMSTDDGRPEVIVSSRDGRRAGEYVN